MCNELVCIIYAINNEDAKLFIITMQVLTFMIGIDCIFVYGFLSKVSCIQCKFDTMIDSLLMLSNFQAINKSSCFPMYAKQLLFIYS